MTNKVLQLKIFDKKSNQYKNSGRFEIRNETDTKADLLIYGDIVSSEWGKWEDTDIAPSDIRTFLDGVKGKDLDIYINSGGGSVFAGMAIYNMLKRHEGVKNGYVDGLAGSITSVILFACDNIFIPSNAYLMIHKAWNISMGNADDFRKMADTLDTIDQGILNVYQDNLKEGVGIDTIKDMVANETWLTGNEAEKYFNINVTEENTAAACITKETINEYKNMPEQLKNKITNENNDDSKKNLDIEIAKAKLLLELEL